MQSSFGKNSEFIYSEVKQQQFYLSKILPRLYYQALLNAPALADARAHCYIDSTRMADNYWQPVRSG